MENDRKQKFLEEYAEKQQLYSEFASLVSNLLEVFLRSANYKFQSFSRPKDKSRLAEKIDRKAQGGKEYKTLEEIEDLAGVRIVFYLEDDKKKFLQEFIREFQNCIVDAEEKYDPHGYRGQHFIFRLNKERAELVEYRKYASLKCEIQISTILFHAWSEVEHDIIYKPTGNKNLLQALGLDELKQSFEKVMVEHLQAATYQLDFLNKKYQSLAKAEKVFASDFLKDVTFSKNNDEIYEILGIVGEFYHKKPDETLAIITAVIGKKPLEPVVLYEFADGKLYGKTHKDLIIKCLEMLAETNICYFRPDEVLGLLAALSLKADGDIGGHALEGVKKFARYDYNYLTQVKNYTPQRKALDFVLSWKREEQLRHISFIKVILKEVLSPSIGGTTPGLNDKSEITLTMHFGVVSPTDFLKKMRREVIDLAYELYKAAEGAESKLEILSIFDEASGTPANVAYGDDVAQMLADDLKYLIGIYRKIVFGERGDRMIDDLGIVAAIEQKLYWMNRRGSVVGEDSKKLRSDILRDDLYDLFRLLVGDPVTYQDEEGWDTAEKKRNEKVDRLVDSIKETDIADWSERLNKIASQQLLVEDWKFMMFKNFLQKLSETRRSIAEKLLDTSFANNSSLKNFTMSFLDGFRAGAHLKKWDDYVDRIIEAKDTKLIVAVIFSLNLRVDKDLQKFIREKDIDILEGIIKKEGKFSFLKEADDRLFHYALFNTLMRNFKRSPGRIEPLIFGEIKGNPKFINIFFAELPMAMYRKWISINELNLATVGLLKKQIAELPDLDWHAQDVITAIGERDGVAAALEIFMARIQKEMRKKEEVSIFGDRYEPIPYHFNPSLLKILSGSPEYMKIAGDWVADMTTEWSVYNWHVSHFLQRTGSGFREILTSLTQKGDDDSLMKAARAMQSIDGTDLELCIEIVKRTDNRDILNQVESNFYATGVVSGEYGFVEAYESKVKNLERYKTNKNERVKKFVDRMIKSLLDSAKRERQRADEGKQLRKIEFGN